MMPATGARRGAGFRFKHAGSAVPVASAVAPAVVLAFRVRSVSCLFTIGKSRDEHGRSTRPLKEKRHTNRKEG
jgi:hypothetical protein